MISQKVALADDCGIFLFLRKPWDTGGINLSKSGSTWLVALMAASWTIWRCHYTVSLDPTSFKEDKQEAW